MKKFIKSYCKSSCFVIGCFTLIMTAYFSLQNHDIWFYILFSGTALSCLFFIISFYSLKLSKPVFETNSKLNKIKKWLREINAVRFSTFEHTGALHQLNGDVVATFKFEGESSIVQFTDAISAPPLEILNCVTISNLKDVFTQN
jgi:hypothetical protein